MIDMLGDDDRIELKDEDIMEEHIIDYTIEEE